MRVVQLKSVSVVCAFVVGVTGVASAQTLELMPEERTTTTSEGHFSSSYLPYFEGHLHLTAEKVRLPGSKEYYPKSTLAERFDEAVAKMIPSGHPLEAFMKVFAFDPVAHHEVFDNDDHTSAYEGFCDQFATANNDPKVKKLLKSTQGLDCEGIPLTKGDLQELFTAFYTSKDTDYYGARNYVSEDDRNAAHDIAVDELNRATFYARYIYYIHGHLDKGEGIVLNVDSGPEVWNQPVKEINSSSEEITDDPEQLGEYRLPSYLFAPSSKAGKANLSTIKSIEAAFEIVLKNANISAPKLRKKLSPALQKRVGAAKTPASIMTRLAEAKAESLQALLESDPDVLPEFRVFTVRSDVEYIQEGEFRNTELWTRTVGYDYVVIWEHRKDGSWDIADDSWITDRTDRPADMFVSTPTMDASKRLAKEKAAWFWRTKAPKRDLGSADRAPDPKWLVYEQTGKAIGLSYLLQLMRTCENVPTTGA